MASYSIFDIIGPVMIGPSSSHTAGAVRLGLLAKNIVGEPIVSVIFYLHGSFAETHKGHGTDVALLAGILGYATDAVEIRNSFEIAKEKGINYAFEKVDLGEVHPNTVEMVITSTKGNITEVTGSSIGGGKVMIQNINGMSVQFSGEYSTLITEHRDEKGVIAQISGVLASENVNIAYMQLHRGSKGKLASLIVECDQPLSQNLLDRVTGLSFVEKAKVIPPL